MIDQFATDIPPDVYAVCSVCSQPFARKETGRRRKYCSDACKIKAFRYTQGVTKRNEAQRNQIVEQYTFSGDWCFQESWPEWCKYQCLTCATPIEADTPAWVDRDSWDQIRGKYKRLICDSCMI